MLIISFLLLINSIFTIHYILILDKSYQLNDFLNI